MYCMKCGKQMEDDAKFCPECGAPADMSAQQNPEQTQAIQQIEEERSPKVEIFSQSAKPKDSGDALLKYLKGKNMTKIIIALVAAVVIIVGIISVIVVVSKPKPEKGPGPQKVDTVSTLIKVVKSSSFSTYEVVYNGVCTVYNEDKPDKVDYYVSYTSTIKAGFDFNEIEITKDDKNHEIVVSLPPIELYEPDVKIEELDYIIVNKKVETETISADAYKICKEDVEEKAKQQDAIYKYAEENGERLVRGLVEPFVESLDEDYTIRIEWRETK